MRRKIERSILDGYRAELERSKEPGYVPQTFPDLDYDEPSAEAGQPEA